jgi:hypothetical protein
VNGLTRGCSGHACARLASAVSVINFNAGQTRANNAIISLGPSGDVTVHCGMGTGGQVDFILDMNGYVQ